MPYPGMSNEKLFKFLAKGNHMERPKDCPRSVYAIMERCWALAPEDRPTFVEVRTMIEEATAAREHVSFKFISDTWGDVVVGWTYLGSVKGGCRF